MLSVIAKKVIASRLMDRGIEFSQWELDNYMIDMDKFNSFNELYESVVNNWGKFIIE
jgi:hypothetical protein